MASMLTTLDLQIFHTTLLKMGAAGEWIKKEALASVPAPVLSTRIRLIAIWASYCGALHGFNSANINGIMSMKPFKRDFGIIEMSSEKASNTTGWVTSAMLLVRLRACECAGCSY